mmetsp:Transcript_41011/g.87369  ORF Transcript_41011/g.87369 Transcript_41011/m.87369 type:complete len:246 (-) Transcript_41011:1690-2427(-)
MPQEGSGSGEGSGGRRWRRGDLLPLPAEGFRLGLVGRSRPGDGGLPSGAVGDGDRAGPPWRRDGPRPSGQGGGEGRDGGPDQAQGRQQVRHVRVDPGTGVDRQQGHGDDVDADAVARREPRGERGRGRGRPREDPADAALGSEGDGEDDDRRQVEREGGAPRPLGERVLPVVGSRPGGSDGARLGRHPPIEAERHHDGERGRPQDEEDVEEHGQEVDEGRDRGRRRRLLLVGRELVLSFLRLFLR